MRGRVPTHRTRTIARGQAAISKRDRADEMDYTLGEITQGKHQKTKRQKTRSASWCIPVPGPLLRLGVELVIEAYERDPQATLARLADVATRGDEPFQIPPELLVAE